MFSAESEASPRAESTPVDLGLPSGLKWAAGNLGAEKETDAGLFFAWGETTGYIHGTHDFTAENYTGNYMQLIDAGTDLPYSLDSTHDAVHVNMGGEWRMPTEEECNELLEYTTQEWIHNYNNTGIDGVKLSSKNDSSKFIFFPAYGEYNDGRFLSSTIKFFSLMVTYIYFNENITYLSGGDYFKGCSVRGVCK